MKYYFQCILDDFFARQKGICSSEQNIYNDYFDNLKLAKLACNKDSHCIGVQQKTNGFRLCKKGLRKPDTLYVYEKQVATGKNPFVSFLIIRS